MENAGKTSSEDFEVRLREVEGVEVIELACLRQERLKEFKVLK